MQKPNRFGDRLRELRISARRTMGQVAREMGISTVYYSDVERGRRNPFPMDKVSYQSLAAFIGADLKELESLATAQRNRVQIDLDTANFETRHVAVALARRLSDESLTQEQIEEIRRILEGKKDDPK